MKAPGKKVAVLGLGVSGYASAVFLAKEGFQVFVSDQGNLESVRQRVENLRWEAIEVETEAHTLERILEMDWVLISPGIRPSAQVVQAVRGAGLPLYSEIEVASWFCASDRIIAVTGSCGKTTVTTLLGRVFQRSKERSFVCGNIGNPWIAEIPKIRKGDFVIVEVSSFQLAYCENFRPHAGVLLNLSPNHQDWHADMEDYVQAKLRLFRNQTSDDYAVLRRSDCKRYFPDLLLKAQVCYFDETNPNEEAVRLVAKIFGCSEQDINDVLSHFEGIEHRLEKVANMGGVSYVNDSKCTTTASLAWALEKFQERTVILLAGGHPKSDDFAAIRPLIQRKVRKAILIGEARPLLRRAWEGACDLWETDDFKASVVKAAEWAKPGDTVLLSPACASFDMFHNYIERGGLFKKLVRELAGPAAVSFP